MKRKVIIIGAAGRDFHNFNVFFRNNKNYDVVCFTAAQIPGIEGRKYPAKLAGELYPNGIPIYAESELEDLIKKHNVDEVVFAYSDVSHEHVMHIASRALSAGATFVLQGPNHTMLKSKIPVIAVCAVRTGAGKSPLTRKIASILRRKGKKFVVVRHPMPYGQLEKQEVERFEKLEDLEKYKCTIEEMEEYEHHIKNRTVVYAGVDYEKILKEAEKEAEIILWDGGNNDIPFYKPDLLFVVADSLRADHELAYHPGETNFRMADVIVVNKYSGNEEGGNRIVENAKKINPRAEIVKSDMELTVEGDIQGKKVLVVEDGPTVTHGGMAYGAGYVASKNAGAKIIDPRKFAVGSIKETFEKYPHLREVLPAMGYGEKQMKELEETINKSNAEVVVIGTPIDLGKHLKVNKKCARVAYSIKEIEGSVENKIDAFLKNIKNKK
ncbi:MAG: cyclic 2,3-diphosphoglycerate synthase [Candidatus Anstonellales archaeon]